MTTETHTPGPWNISKAAKANGLEQSWDWAIYDADKQILAEAFQIVDEGIYRPVEANARLMAASPKLLNCLKRTVALIRETKARKEARLTY